MTSLFLISRAMFLSALADARSIDEVANAGANRASLPDGGVLLAVASLGPHGSLDTGEIDDSCHLEAVIITKGARPATKYGHKSCLSIFIRIDPPFLLCPA